MTPTAAEEQITWEHQALRAADINVFWFCKETDQPIVLFELGATMERLWNHEDDEAADWDKGLHLVVGVEAGYSRIQDVEIQTKLALGYRRQLDRTFDQFLNSIKSHINWFHDSFGKPE